jgi:hypothetical protein
MKRAVGPGATIPLDELYEQYGKRHNIEKGEQFVRWLREVKLRDPDKWEIYYIAEEDKEAVEVETEKPKKEEEEKVPESKPRRSKEDSVSPFNSKEMTVSDVVELSVRQAREVVPNIRDIQLLKYAEKQANQRAGKDSLRRILMKRIQELQVSNRR